MEAELHLLAGLNGSGKTTYARHLEATLPAVRFSLDEWMLRLYGLSFDDERYPALAEKCRSLIWDLTAQTIAARASVVIDWNMWSRERRADAVTAPTGWASRVICVTSGFLWTWLSGAQPTAAIRWRTSWTPVPSAISLICSSTRTARKASSCTSSTTQSSGTRGSGDEPRSCAAP